MWKKHLTKLVAEPSRAELRARLIAQFRTDTVLDGFLIDHFLPLHQQMGRSWCVSEKYNYLLTHAEPAAIVSALDSHGLEQRERTITQDTGASKRATVRPRWLLSALGFVALVGVTLYLARHWWHPMPREQATALNQEGIAALEHDKCEAAERAFSRAIDLCPGCEGPRRNLAVTFLLCGQPKSAIAVLDELLQRRPDDGQLLLLRGDARIRSGHPDEAIADLQQAATRMATDGDAWLLLGQTLDWQGETARATGAYCQARAAGKQEASCLRPTD